jgi:hypothetical protein
MASVGSLGFALVFAGPLLLAQSYHLVPATPLRMPTATVDGNSPAFRDENGTLHVYTSTGAHPTRMSGPSVTELTEDWIGPSVGPREHYPIWIEAVWRDEDGTVYGWFHHEPDSQTICGNRKLTTPRIGALVSTDGGSTFTDLGLVLTSGDRPNCSAQNGFFAGGHGDFSVVLDRERRYFYFVFTNYGGSAHQQGVSMARMAFEDRAAPVGTVRKQYLGEWSEPGIGGMVTPIFPATTAWDRSDADSFWGAAVHWNSALESYVAVMNRACCKTNWPQEGIYIAFNPDLANPGGFSRPAKLVDDSEIGFAPGYYPQVFGLGPGETDSLAGAETRLFIKGFSKWRLVFGDDDGAEGPSQPPIEPIDDCMTAECPATPPDTGFSTAPRSPASPNRNRR